MPWAKLRDTQTSVYDAGGYFMDDAKLVRGHTQRFTCAKSSADTGPFVFVMLNADAYDASELDDDEAGDPTVMFIRILPIDDRSTNTELSCTFAVPKQLAHKVILGFAVDPAIKGAHQRDGLGGMRVPVVNL